MKALFMTTMVNGVPNLPPFEAEDGGIQLYHTVDGVLCGGYSCLGQVPVKGIPSMLVQVWASNATLDAMDADNDYVFIEDVEEPAAELAPVPELASPAPKRKRSKAKLAVPDPKVKERKLKLKKARAFMLKHAKKCKFDEASSDVDAIEEIRETHGITPEQWRAGRIG